MFVFKLITADFIESQEKAWIPSNFYKTSIESLPAFHVSRHIQNEAVHRHSLGSQKQANGQRKTVLYFSHKAFFFPSFFSHLQIKAFEVSV